MLGGVHNDLDIIGCPNPTSGGMRYLMEGFPSAWVLIRLKEVNCLNVNGFLEN